MTLTPWGRDLFGEQAAVVKGLVPEALREAHDFAAAAQGSSGTMKRDPYGHTLKNTQHERLVAAVAERLPGSYALFRPQGASYELVRFPETGVVLYPWRYGSSIADRRESARMQPSGTRQGLLAGVAADSRQLTIEHAHLSQEELDEQLDDDAAVLEQLRSLARVVVVAYASNPKALIRLGWGEADLIDERGSLHWRRWEDLPLLPDSGEGGGTGPVTGGSWPRPPLRPVEGITPELGAVVPRFDDAPLDDELVRPRRPHSGEPTQEPEPIERRDTGTDQPDIDDQL